MKKIFALVLAVAMMSTMAMAADYTVGTDIVDNGAVNPNKEIGIPGSFFAKGTSTLDLQSGELCNANFAISARKFSKGANLVKSVTISDDDEMVIIALNQDLNLVGAAAGKANNLVIDEISVKSKKKIDAVTGASATDAVTKSSVYKYDNTVKGLRVGYVIAPVLFTDATVNYANGTVTEFKKGTDTPATTYGIASIDGTDIYVEGRVYAGDKIYVNISNGAEKEVLKAYPDADLRFAKLETSGFTSNNVVQVTADEDEFVYEIVDKKVVKTNLKWDADAYAWVGKTTTSKYYVISDIELAAVNTPAEGVTNPGTGANDVVGIAAALAVVSLVAAGAVSLKK